MAARALILVALAALGCDDGALGAARAGLGWFTRASLSSEGENRASCVTCHDTAAAPSRAVGGTLAGVTARPTFWNGAEDDLLDAVNACLTTFMRSTPIDRDDGRGRALFAYLATLSGPGTPVTYSIELAVTRAPSGGDAGRGAEVYDRACGRCHGEAHSGDGRLDPGAPTLPEEARALATQHFPALPPGLVLTEKVRHGAFFGVGGWMPFFSLEALTDPELADLLAFLGM